MLSSRAGSPDGLSFCSTSVPLVSLVVKVSVTSYGTKSVVIHSPCACAGAIASSFPLLSSNFTGKLASKYHVPRASPLIRSGLLTVALGAGVETVMSEETLEATLDAADELDAVLFIGDDGRHPERMAAAKTHEALSAREEVCMRVFSGFTRGRQPDPWVSANPSDLTRRLPESSAADP